MILSHRMGPPTSILVAVVAGADVGGLVGVEGHRLVVVVIVGVVDVHLGAGREAGVPTPGTLEPQPSRRWPWRCRASVSPSCVTGPSVRNARGSLCSGPRIAYLRSGHLNCIVCPPVT